MSPQVVSRSADARRLVLEAKASGKRVGVVPTMGALHEGHLSLVEASSNACDFNVVTVFVNPTQFAEGEDFEKYPRDLQTDLDRMAHLPVDLVYAPPLDEVYRENHSTYVSPPRVSSVLEGKFRPDHFGGVATIVLKLFQIIPADVGFFGQKDFQQTLVIRDMVDDLDVPVEIKVCPIVREPDGLAMSSRNVYLSDEEREMALAISQALKIAEKEVSSNHLTTGAIKQAMRGHLVAAGIRKIDYVEIVDATTLEVAEEVSSGTVALIAAYVGTTRLIDNLLLG